MRKIVLADGQEFEIAMCGESRSGTLWIEIDNNSLTFLDIMTIFGDKEKTKRISETDAFGIEHVYEGYIELVYLQKQQNGNILFALDKVVTA